MASQSRAFTLIELLVVIGIIAVLVGMLLPALRRARLQSEVVACSSNLRQHGMAIQAYVNDHSGLLPFVVEPVFRDIVAGGGNWAINPTDPAASQSYWQVMQRYVVDLKLLRCPTSIRGYPLENPQVGYRFSAANNFDGTPVPMESFLNGSFALYFSNLKYLNGRKFKVQYADIRSVPVRMVKGVGPYYLVRDFIIRNDTESAAGTGLPEYVYPHSGRYNRLRLDMSVTLDDDSSFDPSP